MKGVRRDGTRDPPTCAMSGEPLRVRDFQVSSVSSFDCRNCFFQKKRYEPDRELKKMAKAPSLTNLILGFNFEEIWFSLQDV